MITHDCEKQGCGSTTCESCGVESILEHQLRKSVALTKRPDDEEDAHTLERLKALLAETRELTKRAEALVASLRAPRDYYAG